MKPASLMFAVLGGVSWGGCAAPVQIPPGMSALRVRVKAEPKAGVGAPLGASFGGEYDSQATPDDPYQRIDYAHLGEIVVVVRPQAAGAHASPPEARAVITANPSAIPPVHATSVGGAIVVSNADTRPHRVYSVSEGNVFDLGEMAPGESKRHQGLSPGLVELLGETRDRPIATVFVAAGGRVVLASSGKAEVFNDLPPGACDVECWHARLPGSEARVELLPGKLTEARMTIGVNKLPKVR